MKKILAVWSVVLFGFAPACFGAAPKANFSDPDFRLMENGMYNRFGAGSVDALMRFKTNQVDRITVGVYQEDGTGGFNNSVRCLIYPESETFEDAILRVANSEFNRIATLRGYRMNQMFSLQLEFSSYSSRQFMGQKVAFRPEADGTLYKVPSTFPSMLVLQPLSGPSGTLVTYWPGIKRAALIVFDSTGKLVYKGDSIANKFGNTNFYVTPNLELVVAQRFLTNGFTGVLTVVLNDGTSGTYKLEDGTLAYPLSVPPYVSITIKNGLPTVEISGGTSCAFITLRKYVDLSCPDKVETEAIKLNEVGSFTWTPPQASSSVQIFSVSYDE